MEVCKGVQRGREAGATAPGSSSESERQGSSALGRTERTGRGVTGFSTSRVFSLIDTGFWTLP